MYSRGYSDKRDVYSGMGNSNADGLSLPPRYSGVRFMKGKRSDGREGVFERTYTLSTENESAFKEKTAETETEEDIIRPIVVSEETEERTDFIEKSSERNRISEFFSSIKEDDLLIIALILILSGQQGENNREIILLLALLLCFR